LFAASKMNVYQSNVRGVLGEQALGLGYTRSRAGHIRTQKFKVLLQGISNDPRILHQKDI
jgi:hypothetical protein